MQDKREQLKAYIARLRHANSTHYAGAAEEVKMKRRPDEHLDTQIWSATAHDLSFRKHSTTQRQQINI